MPRTKVKKAKPRADGRVCKTLVIGKRPDGKPDRKFFYGATEEEAKAARTAYVKAHPIALANGAYEVTLRMWSERWLPTYNGGRAKNTYENRKCAVRKITEFEYCGVKLGDMPIADIKPSQIQALMTSLAGMSKSMITIVRCMARNMFDAAVDEQLVKESPFKRIKSPKAGKYVGHRDLEPWEQAVIDKAAPHHRAGLWAILMMYAGIRPEEMAALEWADIKDGFINVCRASEMDGSTKDTKTEAGERKIPVVPRVQAAIDRVPKCKRAGLVCTASGGQPLTETSYRQGWNSFLLACLRAANGIEPIDHTIGWRVDRARKNAKKYDKPFVEFYCTAYDLRYTYATMLYEGGVDVKTAAYLLGHKDIVVTMRIYTKLSERKKAMSFDSLRKYFDSRV